METNYINTSVEVLKEELKNKTVVFEFTKKDGTIRTATGTLCKSFLPEQEDEIIKLEKKVVEDMIAIKGYIDINDYAKENKVVLIHPEDADENFYYFKEVKTTRKKNENVVSYYDLDRQEFRSFVKENYLGILEIH